MNTKKGRVTVPTDVDVIEETLNIIERWGADAIRDCDGTSMPEQLRELDVKQYATYYRRERIMHGQVQIRRRYSRCI